MAADHLHPAVGDGDGLVREAAAAGTTVLFASHELDRATALAERQLTVVGGQVHETQPFASPQLVGAV